MQVQVNTDSTIDGHDKLIQYIEGEVDVALARFGDQITRVEVHLSDENAGKPGDMDKRCVIEARAAGRQPVAVTHHAATVDESFSGAVHKLQHLLDSTLGKLDDHKGGATIRGTGRN